MKTEEKEKCFGAKCSNIFYKEQIINNKIYVFWKNMIYKLSENWFLYLMKGFFSKPNFLVFFILKERKKYTWIKHMSRNVLQ